MDRNDVEGYLSTFNTKQTEEELKGKALSRAQSAWTSREPVRLVLWAKGYACALAAAPARQDRSASPSGISVRCRRVDSLNRNDSAVRCP